MSFRLRARQQEAIVVAGTRIADPNTAADLDVDLGAGVVMPGLINAHDHLHRNHYPRLGSPPYPDVYAWGEDLHSRFASDIDRAKTLPRDRALLFGALKNLVGGVTTVVHHDRLPIRCGWRTIASAPSVLMGTRSASQPASI